MKVLPKIPFNKKLKELGIVSYKSNSSNKFKVSVETLNEIASDRKWIHSTDEYHDSTDSEKSSGFIDNDLDHGLDIPCTHVTDDDIIRKLTNKEKEVQDLEAQFEKMRLDYEALQQKFLALEIVRNEGSEINFIDLDEMIDEAPMKTLIKKSGSKNTLQKINEKI